MKFSREVENIISSSMAEAKRLNSEFTTPEHLFLGLIKSTSKETINILTSLGVEIRGLAETLEEKVKGEDVDKVRGENCQ